MDQQRNIFREFASHFTFAREDPQPMPEDDREFVEEIRDRRAFVSTRSFASYRERLVMEIDALIPDPSGGTDTAAACAFTQAGLRRAVALLDNMAALAKENPDG